MPGPGGRPARCRDGPGQDWRVRGGRKDAGNAGQRTCRVHRHRACIDGGQQGQVAAGGQGQCHPTGHSTLRRAGLDQRGVHRSRQHRAARGELLRGAHRRARHPRPRPPGLCPGRAGLDPRLRRPRHLRRARHPHLHGRHPRHAARRFGPDLRLQPRFGRPRGGASRAVLGAVRQRRRRRDPDRHGRWHAHAADYPGRVRRQP